MNPAKGGQEAVAPVIGVALMVAITVTIAAVVFVLSTGAVKESPPEAHHVGFQTNEAADRLVVVTAEPGARWDQVTMRAVSCASPLALVKVGAVGAPHQNADATNAASAPISALACASIASVAVASTPTQIASGDFLEFCSTGVAADGVTIELTDSFANRVLRRVEFHSIAVCQ